MTVPFKQDAWRLAMRLSKRAQLAEAVNTLRFDGPTIYGDNTDGVGLCTDICDNLGVALQGKRILLLGAGGAVRGVLLPLERHPASLTVANRTAAKAQQLAEQFASHGPVSGGGYADLAGQSFDVIINGTSASLTDELPPLPSGCFASGSLAYDMMYGKGLTPFLQFAQQQGAARQADGLGMLVEQAAESFYCGADVKPRTQPVIAVADRLMLRWVGRSLLALSVVILLYQLVAVYPCLVVGGSQPSASAFMEQQLAKLQEEDPSRAQPQMGGLRQDFAQPEKRTDRIRRRQIFDHDGFDWEGIQTAWEKNLKKAASSPAVRPSVSSWRKPVPVVEENPWRKAEEAIITVMLEQMMSKERIFEIYLNVIEWGNGVFGAEAAARHYYKTGAASLSAGKRQNWRQWCRTRAISTITAATANWCARRRSSSAACGRRITREISAVARQ